MPEPVPSGIAAAAQVLARTAARDAVRAETDLTLTEQVARGIVTAGFARHFVPAEHGGDAGTFTELVEPLITLGRACPATAWCAALGANVPRMAATLPAEGRKRLWQDAPDTFVVGAVSPRGTAVPREGGWTLSGQWPYTSAVDHSEWALVLAMTPGADRPVPRFFAIPRTEYRIERTWSDIGMRATGSNTLIVAGTDVPAELSFAAGDLIAGRGEDDAAACHRVPLPAVNGLTFCLPMLGAARGALDEWSARASGRFTGGSGPGPGKAFYATTLARSSGELDAAELLLRRAAATADRGAAVAPAETARNQRDCALAADLTVGAVDRLFRASGTAGHSTDGPLQRFWRDVHSASGHVVLQFEPAAMAYAEQVFA
jgi:alkylation response protein AidB-like acyl-CoA dehydrogenase